MKKSLFLILSLTIIICTSCRKKIAIDDSYHDVQ